MIVYLSDRQILTSGSTALDGYFAGFHLIIWPTFIDRRGISNANELYASVLGPTFGRFVCCDRAGLAVPLRGKSAAIDAVGS